MNDDKLRKLFEAARGEIPVTPSNTFADRVVSSLAGVKTGAIPPFDAIALMAQKLFVPAVALMVVCVAVEFYFSPGIYSAPADTAQLTEEWLFTLN